MPHCNVKNDVIICSINMVLVAIPIAGFNVDLDVPLRQVKFVYNNCIPKIGAVITVDSTGVDYIDPLAFRGNQLGPHRVLPY
jgi:hypothetical protein